MRRTPSGTSSMGASRARVSAAHRASFLCLRLAGTVRAVSLSSWLWSGDLAVEALEDVLEPKEPRLAVLDHQIVHYSAVAKRISQLGYLREATGKRLLGLKDRCELWPG